MAERPPGDEPKAPLWRAAVPHLVAAGTAVYVVWVLWLTAVS